MLVFANQPIPTTPITAPPNPPTFATIVPTLSFLYAPTMAPPMPEPTLAPIAVTTTMVPTNQPPSPDLSNSPTNAGSTLEPTEIATTLSPSMNDATVSPSLKPTEASVAPTTPAETNEPTVLPDGSRSAPGSANRVTVWSVLLVSVGTLFFC